MQASCQAHDDLPIPCKRSFAWCTLLYEGMSLACAGDAPQAVLGSQPNLEH